jgi:uncharacterized membrane protein YjjP (DUF1212 family)
MDRSGRNDPTLWISLALLVIGIGSLFLGDFLKAAITGFLGIAGLVLFNVRQRRHTARQAAEVSDSDKGTP